MNFDNRRVIGAGFVLTGSILFSIKAILIKLAYQYPVDSVSLLTLRMATALPIFLIIAAINLQRSKAPPLTFRQYMQLALIGMTGYYLASLFDFLGLQFITAGLERLILFTYPTMVVILSWAFLGKSLNLWQGIALVLTYLGIGLVLFGDINTADPTDLWKGGGWIFLSAFAFAVYLISSEKLIQQVGVMRFTPISMSFAALGIFTHAAVNGGANLLELHPHVYGYAFAMGIFSTVIPSFLLSFGIKNVGASVAAIIGSVGPVSTLVLAYIFLGESITWVQVIGTSIVMSGVLIITLKK